MTTIRGRNRLTGGSSTLIGEVSKPIKIQFEVQIKNKKQALKDAAALYKHKLLEKGIHPKNFNGRMEKCNIKGNKVSLVYSGIELLTEKAPVRRNVILKR